MRSIILVDILLLFASDLGYKSKSVNTNNNGESCRMEMHKQSIA